MNWEDNSTSPIRDVDYAAGEYHATFGTAYFKVDDAYFKVFSDAVAYAGNVKPIEILEDIASLTIDSDIKLQTNGNSIGDLTILNGGKLTLTDVANVNNLYLNATTGVSSQLLGESFLTYANAYIDITLEANNSVASPDLWYAFAVPFDVDVATGIARADGSGTHISGVDYLVWEYNGTLRANTGNGWEQLLSGTLHAGQFYMIGIDGNSNVWRFAKSDNSPLNSINNVSLHEYYSAQKRERGWNAVANATLQYANAATASNISIAQVYINGAVSPRYEVKHLSESSFVMASPFFIQTAGDDELNLTAASHSKLYSPSRTMAEQQYYKVSLLDNNGKELDVVYLTASEDAIDEYEIGKDVGKLMGGAGNPYLWVNAYGYQLCANDALVIDGVATYKLGIYSPVKETTEYQLRIEHSDNYYLYKNGQLVWNNADNSYTLDIPYGTTSSYTLLIGQRQSLPTGLNTVEVGTAPVKFLDNGIMYIKYNSNIYNAQGLLIK